MQSRQPETETRKRQVDADNRPELKLNVEVLEERIAPSLFAYSTDTGNGFTTSLSSYVNWGQLQYGF